MQPQPSLRPMDFGDYLVDGGPIDEGQLLVAFADHWMHDARLADVLVDRGLLPRAEVDRFVAELGWLRVVHA